MTQPYIEFAGDKTATQNVDWIEVQYRIFPERQGKQVVALAGILKEFPDVKYTLKLQQDRATVIIGQDVAGDHQKLLDECSLILSRVLILDSIKDRLFYSYLPIEILLIDFDIKYVEKFSLGSFDEFFNMHEIDQMLLLSTNQDFLRAGYYFRKGLLSPESRSGDWELCIQSVFDYFHTKYPVINEKNLKDLIIKELDLSCEKVDSILKIERSFDAYKNHSRSFCVQIKELLHKFHKHLKLRNPDNLG